MNEQCEKRFSIHIEVLVFSLSLQWLKVAEVASYALSSYECTNHDLIPAWTEVCNICRVRECRKGVFLLRDRHMRFMIHKTCWKYSVAKLKVCTFSTSAADHSPARASSTFTFCLVFELKLVVYRFNKYEQLLCQIWFHIWNCKIPMNLIRIHRSIHEYSFLLPIKISICSFFQKFPSKKWNIGILFEYEKPEIWWCDGECFI